MMSSGPPTLDCTTRRIALLVIGSIYLLNEAASRQGVGLLFLVAWLFRS
jgi:hypothetical protein